MPDSDTPISSGHKPGYNLPVRLIRWLLMFAFGFLILLSIAIGTLVIFSIPIDLSNARQQVAKAASTALKRPVHLDGSIFLLPSLPPALQIDRVRVGHPEGWPRSDFARLGRLQVQVAILPLFRQEVRIDELVIDELHLTLETNSAGESNWLPQNGNQSTGTTSGSTIQLIELGEVTATDLNITYRDAGTGRFDVVHLTRVTGAAKPGQRVTLSIGGTVQEVPFETSFTGGRLASLSITDEPWPVDFSLSTLGADLRIKGSILEPLLAASFSLAVELEVPSTEAIKTLLEIELPFLDKLNLKGQLEGTQSRLYFQGIEANIDNTEITARITADLSSEKPRLDGSIHARLVDVSHLIETIEEGEYAGASVPSATAEKPVQVEPGDVADQTSSAASKWELDTPFIDTGFLHRFDAQLELAVDEVSGGPATITAASLALEILNGRLTAPSTVHFAGVPFTGQFELSTVDRVPMINVSLAAQSSEIGDLARLLVHTEGIQGRFDHATLDLSFKGQTLRDLVETSVLDFSLVDASLTYGNETGDKPVEFTLDQLEMNYLPEQRSRVIAQGALLGEPVSIEVLGGNFTDKFITRKWPVSVSATGGGAQFNAKGLVALEDESQLAFVLSGERFGGLSRWLGIASSAEKSYQLKGDLVHSTEVTRVQITRGQLANSQFRGELGISNRNDKPLTLLTLHADLIDLDKLLALFPESTEAREKTGNEGYFLDAPILPRGISLLDSDVDLSITTLRTKRVMAKDLRLNYRIRDGYVERAPVQGVVAGTRLDGSLGIDLRTDSPVFNLTLESGAIDLGELLTGMGLIDSMIMTAERLDLSVSLQGSSLRDMLKRSRLVATAQGGWWQLNNYEMSEKLGIELVKARLVAFGQEPIALDLEGRINQTPLLLALQTDSLASFAQAKDQIRIQATVNLAQADARFSTLAPLPIQTDYLKFNLAVDGRQVSDLDDLLGISLPPWGPYALRGEFGTDKKGYFIHNLQMSLGQSNLNGDIDLLMMQTPPRLTVGLAADSIQLDDFKTGHWSVDGKPDQEDSLANIEAVVTDKLALLTPEVMNLLNADLQLRVKEVLSGKDRLGNGHLAAKLEAGRLLIDPLTVGIPGGEVELAFELEPTSTDVGLRLDAKIENLDYGYLARRIDPESNVTGLISVDTALSTRGPDLDTVMRHANGNIDLAVWPEEINARLFDLWSTNLLVFVLPRLDTSADSRVNCVITRFGIEDGLMQPNVIFVDTTRVQAAADGMIDLKERNLDFRIRPRSKRPEMFSAQTRLRVQGTFQDFSAGASPAAVAGSVVRIITSPIVVPFQWMFTDRPSADGELECREAWKRKF